MRLNSVFLILIALTNLNLIGTSAMATSVVRFDDPGLRYGSGNSGAGFVSNSGPDLESQFCLKCRQQNNTLNEPSSLLLNVHDYVPFKTIPVVPLTPDAGFLRSIGVVQSTMIMRNGVQVPKRQGFATAFLVDDCHALTNYHVAFDVDHHEIASTNAAVTIGFGRYDSRTKNFETKVTAHPVKGGWPANYKDEASCINDWTLLRLDQCVGNEMGHLELSDLSSGEIADIPASMAGYNVLNDFDRGITFEKNCPRESGPHYDEQAKVVPGEIQHFCSVEPGSSGSPVMVVQDGRPVVVGISCQQDGPVNKGVVQNPNDWTRYNLAVSIAAIKDKIDRLLREDSRR